MKKILFMCILALTFWACGDTQIPVNSFDGKVSISKSVKSWLKIERAAFVRDSHNLPNASLLLVNDSSKNRELFYNINWFDANGMAINSTLSNRQIIRFVPGEQKALSVPAPNDKAASYSLNIYEVTN